MTKGAARNVSVFTKRSAFVRLCPFFWSDPRKAQSRVFLARCPGSTHSPPADASRRSCKLPIIKHSHGAAEQIPLHSFESKINNMVTSYFCPLNYCGVSPQRAPGWHLHDLFLALFFKECSQ